MSDHDSWAGTDPAELPPSEAFALLSHEDRMAALRVLWEADEPLRFTELVNRTGVDDTGNFNYHLGELEGPFLRRTGKRYALTHAGRQAMTAVLTGDFTDRPTLGPTRLDRDCPFCGSDVLIVHDGDKLRVRCTTCEGTFQDDDPPNHDSPIPVITRLPVPPAGVKDRDVEALLNAGLKRASSRWRDVTTDLCPDCGGTTTATAAVCPDHDPDGVCDDCGNRFAGGRTVVCDNCGQRHSGTFSLNAVAHPATIWHFRDEGVDLLDPTWTAARRLLEAEELVHSVDPIDVEVRWTVDGRSLRMRIGTDGGVVDVTRGD